MTRYSLVIRCRAATMAAVLPEHVKEERLKSSFSILHTVEPSNDAPILKGKRAYITKSAPQRSRGSNSIWRPALLEHKADWEVLAEIECAEKCCSYRRGIVKKDSFVSP